MADTGNDGTTSLADWIVLGLLVEQPRHGFSLVKELRPDTTLGHIWSVPNPVVYRALRVLRAKELITSDPTETTTRGPRRVPMRPTAQGRRRLRAWLSVPVEHFRDVRVLLRIKLHLTIRLGLDPLPLLRAQRSAFRELGSAVGRAAPPGTPLERDLLQLWRDESSAAARAFVEQALDRLDAHSVRTPPPADEAAT